MPRTLEAPSQMEPPMFDLAAAATRVAARAGPHAGQGALRALRDSEAATRTYQHTHPGATLLVSYNAIAAVRY